MKNSSQKKQVFANLLIEIGTEEIPARFLRDASKLFKDLMVDFLKKNFIAFDESSVRNLFTPRRLTVFISGVSQSQEDRVETLKGPPVTIALDAAGNWTQAALSFCERNSVGANALMRRSTEKGEYLFIEKKMRGSKTSMILEKALPEIIQKVRFPKSMHWGDGKTVFARPIRWIAAFLGAKLLKFSLESVQSGNFSFGYRWTKSPKVTFKEADLAEYLRLLQAKGVYPDFQERLDVILKGIEKALGAGKSFHDSDRELLEEVANLVEYPNVGVGEFDSKYLSIPKQVLSTVIKYHQKYLPVYDKKTDALLPNFLTVFNGPDSVSNTVIRGNERVLRARLADAAFFWEQDKKTKLIDRVENLKHVVFQEKMGTYYDKKERLQSLIRLLDSLGKIRPEALKFLVRSADLCKADLVTGMVGEFPNLQGTIGSEYAAMSGEPAEVALAIKEHYWPLSGMEGPLPQSEVGSLLALIDKLDTVVAGFAAGLNPSGSQDPYGLRRLSAGLLRIIYEKGLKIALDRIVIGCLEHFASRMANSGKGKTAADLQPVILNFFKERLENLFLSLGFSHNLVRAVVERQYHQPAKAYKIIKDLHEAQSKSFFANAVTIVERTANILKGKPFETGDVDRNLLKDQEEKALYSACESNYDNISLLIEQEQFAQATVKYSDVFFNPVNVFFDKVLVNVNEEPVRINRYRLLKKIHELYAGKVADLSKVAGGTSM